MKILQFFFFILCAAHGIPQYFDVFTALFVFVCGIDMVAFSIEYISRFLDVGDYFQNLRKICLKVPKQGKFNPFWLKDKTRLNIVKQSNIKILQ